MDPIFIKSEYRKISNQHKLLLNLSNKINLNRSDKYVTLPTLSVYHTWKNKYKESYKNNKFKILAPASNDNSNYLMNYILYQILKIVLNISSKNMKH